jgi:hypothetical protein
LNRGGKINISIGMSLNAEGAGMSGSKNRKFFVAAVEKNGAGVRIEKR